MTNDAMILRKQLFHSVGSSGKIILSEKMLNEAGFAPGMFIEIVVKKGSMTIFPLF